MVMENYEDFIQRLSNRQAGEEEDNDEDAPRLIKPSSVIAFHGVRVLPPLLNTQQRDEMRHLRETATSLMKRRHETMSLTFKERTVAVQRSMSGNVIHPLTSTTHDGLPANQMTALPGEDSLENSQITVLFEGAGLKTQTPPDNHLQLISHQMMSSGYVTNENTDVTCDSSWMEGQDVAENIRTAAGLSLSMTRSSSAGSDIISHAPFDGSAFEEQKAAVDVTEAINLQSALNADEGLYRTSLQNLLKKSQDYRRHQRLLRSRAKAFTPPDKLNLSNKENQEILFGQIWKTELRNARERRKVKMQPPDADVSTHAEPQETCADVKISEESCPSTDAPTEEAVLKWAERDHSPVTAGSSQKPVGGSRLSSAVGKRFSNIPAPTFCFSPARSKRGVSSAGPVWKHDTESDHHGNIPTSLNDGGTLVDKSSEQTEQIAQLELNLSSLKALISDLESTLTQSQTDPAGSPADNSSDMLKNQESSPDICLKLHELATKDCGISQETLSQTLSRKIRLSDSVQTIGCLENPPCRAAILTDTSNQSEKMKDSECEGCSATIGSSVCQSYDMDTTSGLWVQGKQLSPEAGVSRVKRRLLMNEVDVSPRQDPERPKALQVSAQPQVDQVRDLLEEERRQQQEILQSLAVRYQFLRSVSLLCPSTRSRLEDTSASPPPSPASTQAQPFCLSLPAFCLPLLAAVVKGFLTRRLLRTERVSQLTKTIKDTLHFLQTLHLTPVREFSSRHDLMLQDRVSLQLRAARYQLHDIIFNSSCSERMKMIHSDRQLSRDRRSRCQGDKTSACGATCSLSAATRKALERKKLTMLQKKSANKTKFSPTVEDHWTLVPKICHVSKKTSPLCGRR